jgi:hypothetical protein
LSSRELGDGRLTRCWTTRDAPLVHLGGVPQPYPPFPPTIDPEPGTIVSWIHNNVWDTNFPSQQGFDRPFRYRVAAAPALRPGDGPILDHRAAASASRPLLAVLARGEPGGAVAERAMLEIEDPSVELVDVVPVAPDGILVRLRSVSDRPVTTAVRPGLPVVAARRATYLGSAGSDLPLLGGSVTIELAPRATAALLLTLEGSTS